MHSFTLAHTQPSRRRRCECDCVLSMISTTIHQIPAVKTKCLSSVHSSFDLLVCEYFTRAKLKGKSAIVKRNRKQTVLNIIFLFRFPESRSYHDGSSMKNDRHTPNLDYTYLHSTLHFDVLFVCALRQRLIQNVSEKKKNRICATKFILFKIDERKRIIPPHLRNRDIECFLVSI